MTNEDKIIQLLEEIRDIQQRNVTLNEHHYQESLARAERVELMTNTRLKRASRLQVGLIIILILALFPLLILPSIFSVWAFLVGH